jgi:hypothetical protein
MGGQPLSLWHRHRNLASFFLPTKFVLRTFYYQLCYEMKIYNILVASSCTRFTQNFVKNQSTS